MESHLRFGSNSKRPLKERSPCPEILRNLAIWRNKPHMGMIEFITGLENASGH